MFQEESEWFMRKKMTLLNSIAGVTNRIVTIFFVFIVRRYFTTFLDYEYLGFEGLFQNVIGFFSLMDLGIGSVISLDLFEPIRKKDQEQVSSIILLYRKVYIILGIFIFVLSFAFSFFIVFFIKNYTVDGNEIKMYFLVYAFGVSISYFFSYKRTLLFAYQKDYISVFVDTITKIIVSFAQIIVLVEFQSYFLYLVIVVFANLVSNYTISIICEKKNLFDKKKSKKLSDYYIKKLRKHVSAAAITNIAWKGINSTDSIIISSILGVVDLAKNANYSTLSISINSIVSSIIGGVSASIGDLIAEGDLNEIKKYFNRYCFIYCIFSSYAFLGMFFVSGHLINIWLGKGYSFEWYTVLIISINLFLSLNFKPLVDYQNYSGSFVFYKPYSVVAVSINLVTSIFLAFFIGINGVFFGTTITYLFMNIVISRIVYNHVLFGKFFEYWVMMFKNIIPLLFSSVLVWIIEYFVSFNNNLLNLIFAFLIVSVVYFICMFICFRKNDDFHYFINLFSTIVKNKV